MLIGGEAQSAWFEAADPDCNSLGREAMEEALEEALRDYRARET